MLIHATYFQTWQILFQFSIGHVSVLRNERKRKISGHPDNVLAPRKSTQDSSQAVQRLQCQHGPLLLRVCNLSGFKALSCRLRSRHQLRRGPGPRPDVSVEGAVLASRLATVDAAVASPAAALAVAR